MILYTQKSWNDKSCSLNVHKSVIIYEWTKDNGNRQAQNVDNHAEKHKSKDTAFLHQPWIDQYGYSMWHITS